MKQKKIIPYPFNSSGQSQVAESNQLDIFKGKSFLEFNEIIGLPVKNGIEHIIYDYELDVVEKVENHRNIRIKKASGIGCTELVLRYLTWKILVNSDLDTSPSLLFQGLLCTTQMN
jgi:hypothetical protein